MLLGHRSQHAIAVCNIIHRCGWRRDFVSSRVEWLTVFIDRRQVSDAGNGILTSIAWTSLRMSCPPRKSRSDPAYLLTCCALKCTSCSPVQSRGYLQTASCVSLHLSKWDTALPRRICLIVLALLSIPHVQTARCCPALPLCCTADELLIHLSVKNQPLCPFKMLSHPPASSLALRIRKLDEILPVLSLNSTSRAHQA
jgi:hypothetical protein